MSDQIPECCKPSKEYKGKNALKGIMYGIIPHIGCILFIVAAVLGATVLMQFFRPLLMNRNIFYYLILISLGFATLSSFFYLRRCQSLSWRGIKSKKGYLSIMYGSTIGINLILFMIIFPMVANLTGNVSAEEISGLSMLTMTVDIPCPGHAPLISNEVQTIEGVEGSEYSFPNKFEVYYDSLQTSKNEILSLEVFEEYTAEVLKETTNSDYKEEVKTSSCSGDGCSGSCGGTCGGCGCSSCSR